MADGISIPGVSNKYKTNDLVESLMAVERIPLTREQDALEGFKNQQSAWRDMNQKMSSLRDSVKSLYSFDNPFSSKLASSSDEAAVTADAGRDAEYGSFKIDVIRPATTDKFLSENVEKNLDVPAGLYRFSINDKHIDLNWKGGKLTEFVTALNRRGGNTLKASLIGITAKERALLIESLKTGEENRLVFEDAALDFAKKIGMLQDAQSGSKSFDVSQSNLRAPTASTGDQKDLPPLSTSTVQVDNDTISMGPRGGFELDIPPSIKNTPGQVITFSLADSDTYDIIDELNGQQNEPVLPNPGGISYKGVTVSNNPSDTTLPPYTEAPRPQLSPVNDGNYVFIKNVDGSETPLYMSQFPTDSSGATQVTIPLSEYPDAQSIVIRNSNTGKNLTLSVPQAADKGQARGVSPVHAISEAADAQLKYEGITITRPSNDIDDIVPNITLHLHAPTEKTATIKIDPDTESAKDALITFVGKYNQVLAQINILSQNKPEIISELDYLTNDEQELQTKRLGMFQGDTSLSTGRSSLMRTVSTNYRFTDDATITLLSQIGISTNASTGASGYNAAQMRGYLEVNESKLDENLAANLRQIKNLFGYDTDGDLIIDNGIGFQLDRQLTAWVQSGGIISTKNAALENRIKSSNTKIARLETQLNRKEAELRDKYTKMEGTLNSLETQQRTMNNWVNSGNNNR